MNNILKYRDYRFFQSSYDEDEQGTILSVSHDFWGTFVTYTGYLLLLIGFIWTLFNKDSRFRSVLKLSADLQKKRERTQAKGKVALLVGALLLTGSLFAQNQSKEQHLNQLSRMLVQDNAQGRIEPFSTFASDVFRKISKENSYKNASSVEVLLGMMTNPSLWQNEPILKVSNDQLEKELGAVDGFVSFNQLFDFENGNVYKLAQKVDEVYHKEQTLRNKYDKEIINLDERINICYEIFSGTLPAIIPVQGQPNAKWLPVSSDSLFAYTMHAFESQQSGNWQTADLALSELGAFQRSMGGDLIPSESKISLEILYNEWNVFGLLAKVYAILGFILLLLHLVYIFKLKSSLNRFFDKALYVYLPLFAVYTLSITSVLSGIVLFVAGMSWMNPEITPLVPVLKSYWLVEQSSVKKL